MDVVAEAHSALPHIREIILFFILAGILIPLLKRYSINPVLGFLLTGMLIGPFGLGQLNYEFVRLISFPRLEVVEVFAEIGIIYLLFSIGMHLSFRKLWHMRKLVFGAGILQMAITAISIAILLTFLELSQYDHWNLFLVGSMLAFSSTAVVVQTLKDQKQTNSAIGRGVIAILLLQDLAVVPLLLLVDTQNANQSSLLVAIGLASIKAAVSVGAIYYFGKRIIRPVFNFFADAKDPESFLALVLLAALGIAGITWLAGLSMALGALLAGLLLAETQFRHEIEVVLKPFGGLLIALFFFSMGMNVDFVLLIKNLYIFVPLSISLYFLKTIIATMVLRLFGLSNQDSVEGGFLLGQGSEFAFIALGIAVANQVIDINFAANLTVILSLTLFITSIFSPTVHKYVNKWKNYSAPEDIPTQVIPSSALENHVVLLGYGRVGQAIGKILEDRKIKYVAIDNNARHCSFFYNKGQPIYFGNEQNPELLRTFNLSSARCVVLTMNNKDSAMAAVQVIQRENANLPIFARAHDKAHAQKLLSAGVKSVILETFEASLQLVFAILREQGATMEQLHELMVAERELRAPILESSSKTEDPVTDEVKE